MLDARHISKTLTTFLAFVTGGFGLHRFYLRGWNDWWGWLHLSSVPLSIAVKFAGNEQLAMFAAGPFLLSMLAGFIEALVIGLTPDERWDKQQNPGSGRHSRSGWPLAVLLVLTLGVGATTLIATLARCFDLLFTGGAYG